MELEISVFSQQKTTKPLQPFDLGGNGSILWALGIEQAGSA